MDGDFDEEFKITTIKQTPYIYVDMPICIPVIHYMGYPLVCGPGNLLGHNNHLLFENPPKTRIDLFLLLCNSKMRRTVTQKNYDEIFPSASEYRDFVHVIVNYLIIKHDIGITIKMYAVGNVVSEKDYYFDKYISSAIKN